MPDTDATATVTTSVDGPHVWPVGVDGARRIEVHVTDATHASIRTELEYGVVPDGPLQLLDVRLTPASPGSYVTPTALRNLPISRIERAGRASAERALLVAPVAGQHLEPASEAEHLVSDLFPELNGELRGNALRRRRGLVHLAKMLGEYRRAEVSGARNPTQVVAEKFDVSAATVRSWMHRARREGLAYESSHPNSVSSSS